MRTASIAYEVRRLLTQTNVTTGHRLFRFVGAEAYAQGGGGMTRDLFYESDVGHADDRHWLSGLPTKIRGIAQRGRGSGMGRDDRR